MGFDAAVQEMNAPKSKAAGIILASDVSPKTEKEICFHAEKRGTPVVHGDFTMDDAKEAVRKAHGYLSGARRGSLRLYHKTYK